MTSFPSFEQFQSRKHFALLDGIRAIAILAVIWHHSGGESALSWSLFERGYLGVDLFFVLSGFLITHLLIKEHRTKGAVSLKKFYVRRTLRIFPLYYGYLLVLLSWTAITNSAELARMLPALPYYILYVSNWMPSDGYHYFHRAWSLAVEEQFYLVWPALVVMLGFIRPALMILGLFALSLLCIAGLFGNGAYDVHQLLVPYRTILLGCLVAIALNHESLYCRLGRVLSSPIAAPVLLASLVIFIGLQSGGIGGLKQLIVHILMAAFLVSCLINEQNHLNYVLTLKWVQLIGITSYGIYILHGQLWGPTNKILALLPGGDWTSCRELFFIIFTAMSILVAYISFNTYERYFLSLKKRFEVK